jgi:hypothetical protein
MNDELTAMRELCDGVREWWLEISDTIEGDLRPDWTALATTGEELTRQAWTIRNQTPTEPLAHRVDRLHTERTAALQQRKAGA